MMKTILELIHPRDYIIYLVLIALISVLASIESVWPISDILRFDREQLDQGQWWRLITANWMHLSFNHYLGNVAGVLLVAYIARGSLNNKMGAALILWSMLVVGAGLYGYADYLSYYVGLSGALHGILLAAPFASRAYGMSTCVMFAAFILGKVIWEQTSAYDDMALVEVIGGRVEVNSHLFGALAGLCFLPVIVYLNHQQSETSNESRT